MTGTGVSADPFQVVTVTDAAAGLRLTQTNSHVTGDDHSDQVEVANTTGASQDVSLYHAADCYLRNDDRGYGHTSGANAYCSREPNIAASGLLGFEPVDAGSHFMEGGYSTVFGAVNGNDLPDTCACTSLLDNGVGINWSFAVANGATVSRTFRTRVSGVDSTAPETNITGGPSGGTVDPTPAFAFNTNEPSATFQCRVDGAVQPTCNSGTPLAHLAPGPHTFSVAATDSDGNADSTPAERSFTVESAPNVTDVDPEGPANDNNPKVKGDAPPSATSVGIYSNSLCTNLVRSGSVAEFEGAGITAPVPDESTTTFYARVSDATGGSDCSTTSVTYVEDSTPPPPPGPHRRTSPCPSPPRPGPWQRATR